MSWLVQDKTRDNLRSIFAGRARYVPDNSNDDHGTDGREDYAVEMTHPAVLLLSAGAPLVAIEDAGPVDFGATAINVPADVIFELRNTGSIDLVVTNAVVAGAAFSISVPLIVPATIPPGAAGTLTVRMQSAIGGAQAGTLILVSNDLDSPRVIGLAGTIELPVLELRLSPGGALLADGETIALETAAVGSVAMLDLYVKNTGVVDLHAVASVLGTGWSVDTPLPAAILPGAEAVLTLAVDTATTGTKLDTLTLTSDAPDSPRDNPLECEVVNTWQPNLGPSKSVLFGTFGADPEAITIGKGYAVNQSGSLVRVLPTGALDPAFVELNCHARRLRRRSNWLYFAGHYDFFGEYCTHAQVDELGGVNVPFLDVRPGVAQAGHFIDLDPATRFLVSASPVGPVYARKPYAVYLSNGQVDPTFTCPVFGGPGGNSPGFCGMWLAGGRMLVGGNWTDVGGVPRYKIARLLASGGLDGDPLPGASSLTWGTPLVMARWASEWVLVGTDQYTNASAQPEATVRLFDADGNSYVLVATIDGAYAPYGLQVRALAYQPSTGLVLFGGTFGKVFGTPCANFGAVFVESLALQPPYINFDGPVNDLAVLPDGRFVAVGEFTHVNGVPRNGQAMFTEAGELL